MKQIKTHIDNRTQKSKALYISPQIERITLDNEISLSYQSDAPIGPGEGMNQSPQYFNNDPFNSKMA